MTGVLKVDDIQDAGANSIVSSNGSGTLTFGSFSAPNITASTAILPDASDGAAIGSASLEWSDIFLADGAVINLGDDQDVTLTHVADTGILLNSSRKIQFGDSATFIHQSSDGVMTVDGEATIDLNASTAVLVSNDLKLDSDAAVLSFGADSDVTLTHVADTGLLLNSTMKLQFNDASQFIQGASATVLDIAATDEIELTATLIEVVGNATVSGTLGVTGVTTSNAGVVVDNITIDGTEIDLSSGDLTLDVAGDIYLNADGGDIIFQDGSATTGKISYSGGNMDISADGSDNDIVFKGNDGGSAISPVSIDMSEGGKLKVTGGTSGDNICDFDHTLNGNAYGPVLKTSGVANDNNTTYFLTCVDSSAVRMRLYSDGDIINHDNSYGAISDERIKQDIVDASSQWNDVKALKIRHYKKKDDVVAYGDNAQKELGVIAQELEASGMDGLVKPEVPYKDYDADVRNGIVKEGDIKDYKSVKYSILYMKAIKALQEAQTRIETLETKVKALEDA